MIQIKTVRQFQQHQLRMKIGYRLIGLAHAKDRVDFDVLPTLWEMRRSRHILRCSCGLLIERDTHFWAFGHPLRSISTVILCGACAWKFVFKHALKSS